MLVCKYCGSSDVMVDAWLDLNTLEIINTYDDWFCNDCESETKPIEESVFLAAQKGECSCQS